MVCTSCGFECASRAESWQHTRATGHQHFRGAFGDGVDDHTPQPMMCARCGHFSGNRADSWKHTQATGHTFFHSINLDDFVGCEFMDRRTLQSVLEATLKDVLPQIISETAPGDAGTDRETCVRPECCIPADGRHGWGGVCSIDCMAKPAGPEAFCSRASQEEWTSIKLRLQARWSADGTRGSPALPCAIYKIHASAEMVEQFDRRCGSIGFATATGASSSPGNQIDMLHGTRQLCQMEFSGQPCAHPGCCACGIMRSGFDISNLARSTGNRGAFGAGHYSTSFWSTAMGYGNVVLLCKVAAGRSEQVTSTTSEPIPSGYHSRLVVKKSGVDELMVERDDQMLPQFLVQF
ncbi:unnamed protein product [Symbiodinium sp. CCMP2592]|nr:unnamed protein product [Symbiodinium sp. CCMP2592]